MKESKKLQEEMYVIQIVQLQLYFATGVSIEREHWTEQANIQINIYTMDKQIKKCF